MLDTELAERHGGAAPPASDDPFVFVAVSSDDWLIHDQRYPADDARRLVACVRQRGVGDVEVVWLRDTDRPSHFTHRRDVLALARRS